MAPIFPLTLAGCPNPAGDGSIHSPGRGSSAGTSWKKVRDRASDGHFNAVAFGSGNFVAVATDTAAYSTDGVHWTRADLSGIFSGYDPAAHWIHAIVYGGGTFIAGGSGGKAAYSADGVHWTAVDLSGIFSDIYCIAHGGAGDDGMFIAGGSGGKAAYSADGVHWTAVDLSGIFSGIYSIAHGGASGDGTFVAVGSDGSRGATAYSADKGETWTAAPGGTFGSAAYNSIDRVAYGNGKFVALDWLGNVGTSPDGVHWSPQAVPDGVISIAVWYEKALGFANGKFTAGGYNGILSTSPDGIHWTPAPISGFTPGCGIAGIACGNNTLVAVGGDGIAYAAK
ncbi:MAG: hypothetical protein LBK62_11880 [Treponema sp.]|jgi:hypothetical protein|nr:hypothetical protein [Treponema sp.]